LDLELDRDLALDRDKEGKAEGILLENNRTYEI
jgi:hypothetical protein